MEAVHRLWQIKRERLNVAWIPCGEQREQHFRQKEQQVERC